MTDKPPPCTACRKLRRLRLLLVVLLFVNVCLIATQVTLFREARDALAQAAPVLKQCEEMIELEVSL